MLAPGRVIGGKYQLKELVGTGGMGAVWLAEHVELGAPVAIKFQHAPLAAKEGAGERFQREARMAARLRSPHVVRVHDYGVDDGVAFMAMELLEGESLRTRLEREERVTPREAARILRQAAAGLDVAHAAGVIHRDIKPSNLFLAREGDAESVKLLDFGIAKWSDGDAGPAAPSGVMGSARYMSPEQVRGEVVDRRSDIWSLGVVAFEMLVGDTPFRGSNLPDTALSICSGVFEKPSERLGPSFARFNALFEAALALRPEARPVTASELADAFAHAVADWQESSPAAPGRVSDTATMRATVTAQAPAGRRRGGVLAAGVGVLVAIGAGVAWQRSRGGVADLRLEESSARASASLPRGDAARTPATVGTASALPIDTSTATNSARPSPSETPSAIPTLAAPSGRPHAVRPSSGRAVRSGAPEQPEIPRAPAPSRSTDPDFGLTLPPR